MALRRGASRREFLGRAAGALVAGGLLAGTVGQLPASAAGAPAGTSVLAQTYEELLRLIPDSSANREALYLNDLASLRQLKGIVPPHTDATFDDVAAYLKALSDAGIGPAPFVSGLDEYARQSWEYRSARGFHLGMVRQTALAGQPPNVLDLIRGTFDPTAIDSALSGCADCLPFERIEVQGVPAYAWGEDYAPNVAVRLRQPFYDALGRGGRLRVSEGHIYRTVATPVLTTALQAEQGQLPTLADAPGFLAMAQGLAELDAYSIMLSDRVGTQQASTWALDQRVTRTTVPADAVARETDPATLLRPYRALGLGAAQDGSGPYMAVTMYHDTPELAAENAEIVLRRLESASSVQVRRPWSELLGPAEARAKDRLLQVAVRLKTASPRLWLQWWTTQDSLLLWK